MAAPPQPNPNSDPNQPPPPPAPPQPPGTDMSDKLFRDQLFLNQYHLDRNLIFDYFSLSNFYDHSCNNQHLRMNSIHPLDLSHLSKMTGIEYMLTEVIDGNLFVLRKQKRDSPEKVTPMMTYYCLDGSIYQAPQLCNIFAARIGRTLYYVSKAFSIAASKLEKIGHVAADGEGDDVDNDSAAEKEPFDFREVKRVEQIISSLQRKLPPAPPPPPLPEGYAPPQTTETESGSEAQQGTEEQQQQLPSVDPIINQGPAKRMKFD